ncbi:MAG: PTS sugar transporter subunit IIA [Lachnospiraceae bacterium]|nr:PTS sugar transporter subunit IIA [Lachnospiraceae bacterium]
MIWEELDRELILTELEAENFEEVFEKLGGVVTEVGYAKDTYVRALINREKEYPTGLDASGVGIAIPHTDISHVIKSGTAIAKLTKPVTFIQMGTEDEEVEVQLIFMLAVKDPKSHLTKLQTIITMIQDPEFLKKLIEADDVDSIIEIIKEKEGTL